MYIFISVSRSYFLISLFRVISLFLFNVHIYDIPSYVIDLTLRSHEDDLSSSQLLESFLFLYLQYPDFFLKSGIQPSYKLFVIIDNPESDSTLCA